MNLAEEFKRLHEGWTDAIGIADAVRGRHAFSLFCHQNAEAIELALGMASATAIIKIPDNPEDRAKLEVLMKQFSNAPLTVMDKNVLPLEPSDRTLTEAWFAYREALERKCSSAECMRVALVRAYAFDAGRPEPIEEAAGEAVLHEETNNRAKPFDVEAERPAFEAWAKEQHSVQEWGLSPLNRFDDGQGYRNTVIQSAWIGWCARAKGKTL